jgi:Transmembrane domain of unknown function (DUF3566)
VTTEQTMPGAGAQEEPLPPVAAPLPPPGAVVMPVPAGRQVVTVRRARVAVTRIDPWSVMKLAFVLSLSLAVVILVALTVLWLVLSSSGVFDQLNATLGTVTGSSTLRLQDIVSLHRVLGVGGLIGVVDVVLLTALATLAAFLFNLSTGLVGGVDVVLTETD